MVDSIVIPINEEATDAAYNIVNKSGSAPPVANARITNSSSWANPRIRANATNADKVGSNLFGEGADVRGGLCPYGSAHVHVFALLRDYGNDHAAFQLGLRLFLSRICMPVYLVLWRQHS